MGLDLAEIILCIEEEFEIDFREEAVAKIETVGDLVDFVEQEVRKDAVPDWKAELVYGERLESVKRELGMALAIPETKIFPGDRLDRLIPKSRRRELWDSSPFFKELGPLTLSARQRVFLALGSIVSGILFVLFCRKIFGVTEALVGWGIGIAMTIASFWVFLSVLPRRTFDSKVQTVADCARFFAAREGIRLNRDGKNWTRNEIERQVFRIISEQAGLKLEHLRLDQHLIHDLNLG